MASFTYEEQEVRVIPIRDMELGDLAFIKREFGFEGALELEAALAGQEENAWRALLVNSVRRVVPGVDPSGAGVDHVRVQDLVEVMNEETDAYLEAKAAELEKRASKGGRSRPTAAKSSSSRARSGGRK